MGVLRISHVHSDEGTLDVGNINFVEGFEISINVLSSSHDVDVSLGDLPGTFTASALRHNFTEVLVFVSSGFNNTFSIATELPGSFYEVFSEFFMHNSNSSFVCFPCSLNSINELIVMLLILGLDSINSWLEFVFETLSLSWGSVHPVWGASSLSEAIFQLLLLALFHTSENPGVEALSSSGLVLWLLADTLVGWADSFNSVCFPSNEWRESLGCVDIFLNLHSGEGINNLSSKQFFILFAEFLVNFTPILHSLTGLVEGWLVPGNIGGDWDCGKVSERHYLEMFLIFIIY